MPTMTKIQELIADPDFQTLCLNPKISERELARCYSDRAGITSVRHARHTFLARQEARLAKTDNDTIPAAQAEAGAPDGEAALLPVSPLPDAPPVPLRTLSEEEWAELTTCEDNIKAHLEAATAEAAIIRKNRLWEGRDSSWEAYCYHFLGRHRTTIDRRILAYEMNAALLASAEPEPVGAVAPSLPESEGDRTVVQSARGWREALEPLNQAQAEALNRFPDAFRPQILTFAARYKQGEGFQLTAKVIETVGNSVLRDAGYVPTLLGWDKRADVLEPPKQTQAGEGGKPVDHVKEANKSNRSRTVKWFKNLDRSDDRNTNVCFLPEHKKHVSEASLYKMLTRLFMEDIIRYNDFTGEYVINEAALPFGDEDDGAED